MRKHISKAITRRSAAIRTALATYNALAPRQKPPRPTLQFSEVASYAYLSDFELLKHSRYDIIQKPWTSAVKREVAIKYFKLLRAQEEIHRLNTEIPRLAEWIDHKDNELFDASKKLEESRPDLAREIYTCFTRRQRVNDVHRARLAAICALDGYSGPNVVKLKGGENCEVAAELNGPPTIQLDEDDGLNDEMARLTECLDAVTI